MDGNYDQLLAPLTQGWIGKIDSAIAHKKKHFQDTADQCMQFFCGASDFFYSPEYQKKYLGGAFQPKFRIQMMKAFELVANFGPMIYNRNPTRETRARDAIEYGPEVFGDPNDPNVQAYYQQAITQEQQQHSVLKSGCQGLEKYLNYTPSEQPNGGLKQASEDACTEALIKGRGVLWTEAYTMPDSKRVLTGSFYDTVDRVLIDPDSESSNFGEAFWIARECIEPVWKVERDRGLPVGSLKNKQSGYESAESRGAQRGNRNAGNERGRANTFDLLTYYKVWSIGGVGARFSGTLQGIQTAFEEVVGDYAYMEVARGVPYPLNFSADRLQTATDDDVRGAFSWPIPYWKDQRWPCIMLDFYRHPNRSWPISPLAPGLGELIALNIIMSRLTYHIYQNTRSLIAVLKSAQRDVEAALKSNSDEVVFGVPEILKDIDSLIKHIQGPAVNYDIFRIIEKLFELFDKRVGLSDLFAGMNAGAASRTSADAETKQQGISIRPDFMASKVEMWQEEVARNEKVCAYFAGVNGESVRPLLGDVGAYVFDKTFSQADEETVLREMTCTITAGSARKPNRQKDAGNLKEIYQPLSIPLTQVASATGDYTKLDELNRRLGEAMEIDMKGLAVGQIQPPAPPPSQEPEQPPPPDPAQEAKAENLRTDIAMQQARQAQQMQISAAQHQQDIQQQAESHQADMLVKLAKMQMDKKKAQQTTQRSV